MMEKKNFVGLLLIMLILFLYPFYIARVSPPPSSPKEIRKTTEIASIESREFQPNASVEQMEGVKATDTVHDTVMENSRLRVTLSNQGAGVKMIRLIRFKDRGGENSITLYKSDSSDKNLFAWVGPFLGYNLNQSRFAYVEGKNRVNYTLTLPNNIGIEKSFVLEDDSDLLKVALRIRNLQNNPLPVAFSLIAVRNFVQNEPFEERYLEIALSSQEKIQREFLRQIKKVKEYVAPIGWLALKSKYFCQILTPETNKASFSVQRLKDNNLEIAVQIPLAIIEPGKIKEDKFIFYAGPLDSELLASYNPDWANIVHYGAFDGIAKFILRILKTGFSIFKNYGVAIILLSILVNIALFPFTWKGMKSMQRLQVLQPEIERLRKDFAADPQRLHKETLELYRKNKVNPFGGCLPLILQMPVFIALYQALSRAIQLKGATFLWIKDLSLPDALVKFPEKIVFIGESFNLLPLLMVMAMYLQQKKSQAVTSPSQKQMTWFMPLFMGLIFYNLPSGLILYWVVSTFLSVGLQSFLTHRPPLMPAGSAG